MKPSSSNQIALSTHGFGIEKGVSTFQEKRLQNLATCSRIIPFTCNNYYDWSKRRPQGFTLRLKWEIERDKDTHCARYGCVSASDNRNYYLGACVCLLGEV